MGHAGSITTPAVKLDNGFSTSLLEESGPTVSSFVKDSTPIFLNTGIVNTAISAVDTGEEEIIFSKTILNSNLRKCQNHTIPLAVNSSLLADVNANDLLTMKLPCINKNSPNKIQNL